MMDFQFPKCCAGECGWGGHLGFHLYKYFWRDKQRAYFVLDKARASSWQPFKPDYQLSEYHFVDEGD